MPQHKLTDLKRTVDDRKATEALYAEPILEEEYSYGLRLDLGQEELDKLGITILDVGQEVLITAMAVVNNVHESDSDDSGRKRSVGLQIQKMDIIQGSGDATKALYGEDNGK